MTVHPADQTATRSPAPVRPSTGVLRPLAIGDVQITNGFWADRQRTNREVSIPIGSTRLREAGNLADLELAAEFVAAPGRAAAPESYRGPVFMDSDVYKWLEAVSWEHARAASDELRAELETFGAAVAAAQCPDGYVNSYVQVARAGEARYRDLVMGHEHYCMGHLIQAAVAVHREFGDIALWQVAVRAADHLVATFGPGANTGLDGHPVVEMALVELFRETGDERYLRLAEHFVTTRGHDTLHGWGREPTYFSDRVPLTELTVPEGHAVRAMYLAAGASDVVSESPDAAALAEPLERQWQQMLATKQYVTGGLGSRWDGEAFGDPYELPPDVAYAETCASIGAVQWAWRRLLATGDAGYADGIERVLFNGFVSGVSLSGDEFFYVNALQVRSDAVSSDHRQPVNGRQQWFQTACCPPNVMRTISQLGGYLATGGGDGITVHQYAATRIRDGGREITVETGYPWSGTVTVTIEASDDTEWTLALRVPGWCTDATVRDPDGVTTSSAPGYARSTRQWQIGDRVTLELPMPVRLTAPHPRVDAARGCRAIERGPIVYAVEQVDVPDLAVDDLHLTDASLSAEHRDDLLGGCVAITGTGASATGATSAFTAVPYCLWANREVGAMRVWLPLADEDSR